MSKLNEESREREENCSRAMVFDGWDGMQLKSVRTLIFEARERGRASKKSPEKVHTQLQLYARVPVQDRCRPGERMQM